jgi:DNA end-binding protein Ku
VVLASRRKQSGDGADGDDTDAGNGRRGRGSRGLWNGAISFSLIHIPVSLHTAARSGTVDLDLLDKRDFAPVGYQRYNKSTGKVVKGYEHEKGEYVVLTD